MTVKRKYIIGIINDDYIDTVNDIISKYSDKTEKTSFNMIFIKQPIDFDNVPHDVTFFQLECENESEMEKKLNELIDELDSMNIDYTLMDDKTRELLVTVKYGGQITIKFDDINFLEEGTFEKIDELKSLHTDIGYCKGFKPNFRPFEGHSLDNLKILPEIMYITSDCEENLLKFRDLVFERVSEINPDLKVEFIQF